MFAAGPETLKFVVKLKRCLDKRYRRSFESQPLPSTYVTSPSGFPHGEQSFSCGSYRGSHAWRRNNCGMRKEVGGRIEKPSPKPAVNQLCGCHRWNSYPRTMVALRAVAVQFDCHPEPASFAERGIWACRFAPARKARILVQAAPLLYGRHEISDLDLSAQLATGKVRSVHVDIGLAGANRP